VTNGIRVSPVTEGNVPAVKAVPLIPVGYHFIYLPEVKPAAKFEIVNVPAAVAEIPTVILFVAPKATLPLVNVKVPSITEFVKFQLMMLLGEVLLKVKFLIILEVNVPVPPAV